MLTAVFLHGHLADKYGGRFDLDVDSVAGAIALLRANFSSFARDVVGHSYRIWVGKTNISRDELINPAKGQDIHIVPVIHGAGGMNGLRGDVAGFLIGPHMFKPESKMGQVVRIIVGIVLIVVGVIFSEFGGMYWGVGIGMGLLLGGVSDYLTFSSLKKLSMPTTEGSSNKVSRYFSGPVNMVGQGNPVPVLYGQLLIGSQVVSGGLSDEDA